MQKAAAALIAIIGSIVVFCGWNCSLQTTSTTFVPCSSLRAADSNSRIIPVHGKYSLAVMFSQTSTGPPRFVVDIASYEGFSNVTVSDVSLSIAVPDRDGRFASPVECKQTRLVRRSEDGEQFFISSFDMSIDRLPDKLLLNVKLESSAGDLSVSVECCKTRHVRRRAYA